MATDRIIAVKFTNMWGAPIVNITLNLSASKSGIEPTTFFKERLEPGKFIGPIIRHYQTGVFSEIFDYWYVEFTSEGDPKGKFWNKNNFSCVIDSDVPSDGSAHVDFWVSGEDTNCYIGLPNANGRYPGEGGYSGVPKNGPGSDYHLLLQPRQPMTHPAAGMLARQTGNA